MGSGKAHNNSVRGFHPHFTDEKTWVNLPRDTRQVSLGPSRPSTGVTKLSLSFTEAAVTQVLEASKWKKLKCAVSRADTAPLPDLRPNTLPTGPSLTCVPAGPHSPLPRSTPHYSKYLWQFQESVRMFSFALGPLDRLYLPTHLPGTGLFIEMPPPPESHP